MSTFAQLTRKPVSSNRVEVGPKPKPRFKRANSYALASFNDHRSVRSIQNSQPSLDAPPGPTGRAFLGGDSTVIQRQAVEGGEETGELSPDAGSAVVAENAPSDGGVGTGEGSGGIEGTGGTQATDGGGGASGDCADPDFCTPYPSKAEAAAAKAKINKNYMPKEGAYFGAESKGLYEKYLSRHKGDSLSPVVFDSPSSKVVESFATSWATSDDQDAIIDLVGERLGSAGTLQPYTPTMMSLATFLKPAEMEDRPINYSNPFSIAGHIAGDVGGSDAGPDYRKITYGNVTLTKSPLIGGVGYVTVETTLHYEVFDAVDFCPGGCGSYWEQSVTVPMSRLEASNEAYDVPFKVIFVPESRSKRFWF